MTTTTMNSNSVGGMHARGTRLTVSLDYRAIRQDDISVAKGDMVEVLPYL